MAENSMPENRGDIAKDPDDPDGQALGKARAAARVAAALRENLKRRKALERARAQAARGGEEPKPD